MRALLQSYPPLGQVTCCREGHVDFSAILDVSKGRQDEPWEVALWHSIDGGDWNQYNLINHSAESAPHLLQELPPSSSFLHFSSSLSFQTSVQFTFKFREDTNKPWKWVRDQEGLNDGIILLQRRATESNDIREYIPDLGPIWKVSNHVSQSPGTQLWSLRCEIPAAAEQSSYFEDVQLGTPWGSYIRYGCDLDP